MSKQTIDCAGQPILEIDRVFVRLEEFDDLPITMLLIDTVEHKGVRRYRYDAPGLELNLVQRTMGAVTLCQIEANVKRIGQAFHRQRSFAMTASVTIVFKEPVELNGLMANYQHKDWWTRPFFGSEFSKLPARVQSLLWQGKHGYSYVIPVVDKTRAELAGTQWGLALKINATVGGCSTIDTLAFAIGHGDNPFELVGATIHATLQSLEHSTTARQGKRYPETMEYLGWCSWDAFYRDVDEVGLLAKAKEFQAKGLPVKWFMIDDGWLDVKDNCLWSFAADQKKFPQGLGHTTKRLRTDFGIDWVGVWHTLAGYWGGIHPDSDIAKMQGENLYATGGHSVVPHPAAHKGFNFWNHWHAELKKSGISFVKVDGQSAIANFFKGQEPVGQAARSVHQGLEASVGLHFDQTIINCMGMASENIWSRPTSALSRNSDDFVPSGEISFDEHALQNAYNSFYHSQFYWGDWDMFWSNHAEWQQGAVLRAMSGGPIYISDRLGETRPEVIWPLVLSDGRVLRLDQPGLPTEDCLLRNPNEDSIPLKIWGTTGPYGILAAFNLNTAGEIVTGTISPSDISLLKGDRFAVYDHFKQSLSVLSRNQTLSVSLQQGEVALYNVTPFSGALAPIGLVDKYLAARTILHFVQGDDVCDVLLAEGGVFGFAAQKEPRRVLVNGCERPIQHRNGLYLVDLGPCSHKVSVSIFL